MIVSMARIKDETINGKLIKCPAEYSNLKNGRYNVTVSNNEMSISVGRASFRVDSDVILRVEDKGIVTYTLANDKVLSFDL